MNVTVLGGGSWGTTVASMTAPRHPTVLWTREGEVAAEVTEQHTNERYLPGFTMPTQLQATDDMERAARHADVLIVAVPSAGFRTTVELSRQWVRPWIPVVSLTKGI
ncbi:MAG: NAD(P)H-dependent glycerol-3-phosphate dehydrogenase, partial [Acidimicrobiaceae bacterium]|nr:NAD(P)H-dependent glycerol-3-phosphate dehydrogenase [Acidimicrobiaceae bacterium]